MLLVTWLHLGTEGHNAGQGPALMGLLLPDVDAPLAAGSSRRPVWGARPPPAKGSGQYGARGCSAGLEMRRATLSWVGHSATWKLRGCRHRSPLSPWKKWWQRDRWPAKELRKSHLRGAKHRYRGVGWLISRSTALADRWGLACLGFFQVLRCSPPPGVTV